MIDPTPRVPHWLNGVDSQVKAIEAYKKRRETFIGCKVNLQEHAANCPLRTQAAHDLVDLYKQLCQDTYQGYFLQREAAEVLQWLLKHILIHSIGPDGNLLLGEWLGPHLDRVTEICR